MSCSNKLHQRIYPHEKLPRFASICNDFYFPILIHFIFILPYFTVKYTKKKVYFSLSGVPGNLNKESLVSKNDYIVYGRDYLHVDHNHELMVSPLNCGIEYMRE